MAYTILDCYTDEPAGLGVPPFLGTYPRYLYGFLRKQGIEDIYYITVDDLRLFVEYRGIVRRKPKTDIRIYNLSKNQQQLKKILTETEVMYIVLGVHTPGKYLSAEPGTLKEVIRLTRELKCKKVLTGPAVFGTAAEGGQFFEKADLSFFNEINPTDFSYPDIKDYSIAGAEIIKQIPDLRIIEIETSHGCARTQGCSFCTEPLKHRLEFREKDDIIKEMKEFYNLGVIDYRIGKQSCFYSYPKAEQLLKETSEIGNFRTLHIDNANPVNVITERGKKITESIVKYCTPGNIAAFGVESFDPEVISANNLNTTPEISYEAVKSINEIGAEVGYNGMPKFLPGINILFGLINESKKTNAENMKWLKRMLDEKLLLRRINIRQVNIFEGTPIYECAGNKYLKKNKKFYWKWREEIRQNIDFPMLKLVTPKGTILHHVRMEVYDGNTTFGRQLGGYTLIVGVKERIPLNQFYEISVKDHMLRSIVGEIIRK